MIENIDEKVFYLRSDFSVEHIHRLSLRVLKEIGMPITSEKPLDLLSSIGCRIDKQAKRFFIPEHVVTDALNKVVSEYEVFDRSGENKVVIGGNNVAFISGAAAIRVKDLDGVYRQPAMKDLADLTRLQDSMENLDVMHEIVEAFDVDPGNFRVPMAAEVFKNTTKPCALVVDNVEDVDDLYNMAVAIRGSQQALREKPLLILHDQSAEGTIGIVKNACDCMMRCAELGIPTGLASYPVMGMTGPVTIEGALALANSNILAGLVIAQNITPGIPFSYMIMAGSTDMRCAETVTASPEIWQYYLAGKKMADFYHMPSECIVATDSKNSDIQFAMEKYCGLMFAVLSGINFIHGCTCEMDGMNLAAYEQILIDDEMISMIKHMIGGFNLSEKETDRDAVFQDIRQSLGNPMYFMDSDVTVKEHRERLWQSQLSIRRNFDRWREEGMKTIIDNSIAKTREILSSYEVEPLEATVERKIESIVEKSLARCKG